MKPTPIMLKVLNWISLLLLAIALLSTLVFPKFVTTP